MNKAFCINCGAGKKDPHVKCRSCGFKAIETLDIVKSVWLSTDRRLSEEDLELDRGPSEEQLAIIAKAIKNGEEVRYPQQEIEQLQKQYEAVSEVSWSKVILVGLPFVIIPLIAFAMFIYKSF